MELDRIREVRRGNRSDQGEENATGEPYLEPVDLREENAAGTILG